MSRAVRLFGAPVAQQICSALRESVLRLQERGIVPGLGLVRIGERPADLSYERGAVKRAEALGIAVSPMQLPADASEQALLELLFRVNREERLHGCLLFRPLPERLDTEAVRSALQPGKDVDGMTGSSLQSLAGKSGAGFPPCTAAACLALLHYHQIPLRGRHVVMVGTGKTVGFPTALMLMEEGATVSACNVFTEPARLEQLCREADLIISAAGKAGLIGARHMRSGQILVDVGMSMDERGKLCGDVDEAAAERIVAGYAPVFGGVSAVTTSILVAHTVQAALRAAGMEEKNASAF